MPATNKLCVVIPVHRPQLTDAEVLSLKACYAHLSNYPCYLLCPQGMDVSAYQELFPNLLIKTVDAGWLKSIESYNRMKVDAAFYLLFHNYEYMLTYELDAYIFNNDIEATNAFNYDYIGAPFFKDYWAATVDAPFIKGGNSGFSIRNIASCLRVLQLVKRYKPLWVLYKIVLASQRVRHNLNKLTGYRYENFISGYFGFSFTEKHINEDLVWSRVVPQMFSWFKVADPLTALKFSFEYNPGRLLELNNGKLPLGCHKWEHHPEFWKKYISAVAKAVTNEY